MNAVARASEVTANGAIVGAFAAAILAATICSLRALSVGSVARV
jgi:hypothetical protein